MGVLGDLIYPILPWINSHIPFRVNLWELFSSADSMDKLGFVLVFFQLCFRVFIF